MSFLDVLRTATSSPQVQLNVFLIEYKPGLRSIFVLLEGRDDPAFYRRFVSARLPNGYRLRLVNCGNRKGVIDAVDLFRSRYKDDERVIAFIDKDHSDLVPNSASTTYKYTSVTRWYSIENYLCEPMVVRRYCVEVLGLPDLDPTCDQLQAQYEHGLRYFHAAAMRCMAWILAARRRGDSLHLNAVDTARVFDVDDDLLGKSRVSESELYTYLERVTGMNSPTPAVPVTAVDAVVDELKSLEPKKWLRGKQEIWFTVSFINKAAAAIKAKGVRAGAGIQLGLGNAIDLLSARCDVPIELDAFLASTFATLP